MPLNKYVTINRHLVLNACSMPEPSNETSCKQRAVGDLVLHFTLLVDDMTPKARACFIFASRAAHLPQKH